MKLYDIPDGKVIYRHDLIEQNTVIAGDQKFAFSNETEAKLLYEAVMSFGPGQFLLPDNETDAQRALEDWLAHKEELTAWFRRRSENYSIDPDYIEKMIVSFWRKYNQYRRGLEEPPASRKSPVHKIKVDPSPDGEPVPIVFGPIPREKYAPPPLEESHVAG
jgi:hypothetical protein